MAPGLCSKTDGRPAACRRCQDRIGQRAQPDGLLCVLRSEREHAPSSRFLPRAEREKAGEKGSDGGNSLTVMLTYISS